MGELVLQNVGGAAAGLNRHEQKCFLWIPEHDSLGQVLGNPVALGQKQESSDHGDGHGQHHQNQDGGTARQSGLLNSRTVAQALQGEEVTSV